MAESVELNLDEQTVRYLRRVAETASTTVDTVVNVLLALVVERTRFDPRVNEPEEVADGT